MSTGKNRNSEKISFNAIPASPAFFLPSLEKYCNLNGYSQRKIFDHALSVAGADLSSGSLTQALKPEGITFSTLNRCVFKPVFANLSPTLVRQSLSLYRTVWRGRKYHVRNTIEWSSFVCSFPDESPAKKYINGRVEAMISAREWSARDKTNESKAYFLEQFYSDNTCVPNWQIRELTSLLQTDGTILDESLLTTTQINNAMRSSMALYQDFYLGVIASNHIAHIFHDEILPRYMKRKTSPRSLVGAVLEWVKDSLDYKSWNQFELDFAVPEINKEASGDTVEYADDKMKRWRRGACNCECIAKNTKCKHSNISDKSIFHIEEQLNSNSNLDGELVGDLLYKARLMDNLLVDLKKSFLQHDSNQHRYYDIAEESYLQGLSRFGEYIERYGKISA